MKTRASWTSLFFFTGTLIGQVFALYNPVREYAGSTFFDRWAYYGTFDNTTWGNVTYVDRATATTNQLTYVNSAGNAVIKVDNTTTILPAPLIYRNSVRLTSTDPYGLGSLIIIDALHIPYGCSVWPSFWTLGTETTWPGAGEIDIIEAINNMNNNQVALHTTPGCFQADVTTQSGTTDETDCSTPQGCLVAENKPNSFGPGFATAGGGVFATQIDVTGVYIWFFSRPDIPANLRQATTSSQIDTTTWGIPTAAYPNSACDMKTFFPPQQLVLLTTLCGVWAGVPSIYQSTCHTPTGSCVADNILGSGSNYANAYWEIRYIRTYLADDVVVSSTSLSPTPGAPSPDTGSTTSSAPILSPSNPSSAATSSASSLRSLKFPLVSCLLLLISVIGLN
ncbi:hypothetical protein BYT27DRAFT_7198151 [Phlegmacium glaucopus]|nr:hypothetical protein BYT27DRAFT_7198151 [Phlegmacium glaucopus]